MNERIARNLRLAQEGLDVIDLPHFDAPTRLTAYESLSAEPAPGQLCPSLVCVTVDAREDGLLVTASLPIALPPLSPDDTTRLLRLIAYENTLGMHGGLVYEPETRELRFRVFCPINEGAQGVTPGEAAFCVRLSAAVLDDTYPKVMKIAAGKES